MKEVEFRRLGLFVKSNDMRENYIIVKQNEASNEI